MINKLELERLKELRNWATPTMDTRNNNNFERLCAMGLVLIGMLIDEEMRNKEKLRK